MATQDRTLITGPMGSITDSHNNNWAITAGGQVTVNTKPDTTTKNVTHLAWVGGRIYQRNTAGLWWSKAVPADKWTPDPGSSVNPLTGQPQPTPAPTPSPTVAPTPSPTPAPATGIVRVQDGHIFDPNGKRWRGFGVNGYCTIQRNGQTVLDPNVHDLIERLFPDNNYLRIPVPAFTDTAIYAPLVAKRAALGKFTCLEYHPWGSNGPYSESQIPGGYQQFHENIAVNYRNQPWLIVESMNEPAGGDMTTEHVNVYNWLRNKGFTGLIMFQCGVGGGNPNNTGAAYLRPSAYANMHGMAFSIHSYGWMSNYSTNPSAVQNALKGDGWGSGITSCSSFRSADGVIPMIISESGDSTDGQKIDVNGYQVMDAVTDWALAQDLAQGYAIWNLMPMTQYPGDCLTDGNGNLTKLGNYVAAAHKNGRARYLGGTVIPTPAPTPAPNASPDKTTVMAGSNNAIVDARGNSWTITADGRVAVNGTPDATTKNVIELAYVNGNIWQENASNLWWSKSFPTDPWVGNGTSVNPLTGVTPPSPTPVPSTGTPVKRTGQGQWLDGSKNGMQYKYLPPQGSGPKPVILFLHQLDMGNDIPDEMNMVDPWFNRAGKYDALVVVPFLDQTNDKSGQTINWGAVQGDQPSGHFPDALNCMKDAISKSGVQIDYTRIYLTGNSMGGLGTAAASTRYNAYNGSVEKVFAAFLSLAGASYVDSVANAATQLSNVPYFAIHGGQDGQVPLNWDDSLNSKLQGRSTWKYIRDNNLGHDVWDTYYPKQETWDWLFQWTSAAASKGEALLKEPTKDDDTGKSLIKTIFTKG